MKFKWNCGLWNLDNNVMYIAWQPICNATWAANALSNVPDTSLLLPTYTCMWCEYTTADKQALKQHVQVVHRGIGNLCDHCGF